MDSPIIRNMTTDDIRLPNRPFRFVYLVQNRNYWNACPFRYDKKKDLVLTFDFAMVQEVTREGGTAAYLDHLVGTDLMERYNHETYRFFSNWFLDKNQQDIFSYRGKKISNALRLHIWTDITYTVHIFINLLTLKHIRHDKIHVGTEDAHVLEMLKLLDLPFSTWVINDKAQLAEYYFPIFRWMHERIYPSPMKHLTKIIVSNILSTVTHIGASLGMLKNGAHNVFIQPYHPTYQLIKRLNLDENINVVLENPTDIGEMTREKFIPLRWTRARYRKLAKRMINAFQTRRISQWHIEGSDIGEYLHRIILERASDLLPECLQRTDEITEYFAKRHLHLMVTVSTIGITNTIILNYCHTMNIPTYLIINGYLGGYYLDESKDAQWINSYGTSIKENYFSGMENVVCLGDPRMDAYAGAVFPGNDVTDNPTIVIGAGSYSNVDLNSYVAVEFDFLNDVLSACRAIIQKGRRMNIIVKVRANGFIEHYSKFIDEYYSDLPVTLFDKIPMKQVLLLADFYITIYSGTLFEASSLGIPVLYYKKDTQILPPPFDGASELVTALTPDDLMRKIELFYEQDHLYDVFKDKSVLEKYVGPLDGKNLDRNMEFIYSLLNDNQRGRGIQP